MIRPALVVGLFVSLGACNEPAQLTGGEASETPTSRTVLRFLEDPGAVEEAWARCRNDPGGIGETVECRDAGHASSRVMMLGRERAIQSLKN